MKDKAPPSSPKRTIDLQNGAGSISLQQQLTGHKARGGGPGGVVWPCGESLAQWLSSQQNGSPFNAKTVSSVLELGCGTGVVGLTLAQLGVPRVVATDGDMHTCALCEANAKAAGLPVTACRLQWGPNVPQQIEDTLARVDRGGRCAEWIVGGDVVYNTHSMRELEVTLRELLLRGGCSLVIIGWCERGQNAEQFLSRLCDLGDVRTAFREKDAKYSYMTRRQGKMIGNEVEFGVTTLSVHPHITAGGGWLHQHLACQWARLVSAASLCLLEGGQTSNNQPSAPTRSSRSIDRAIVDCGDDVAAASLLNEACAAPRLVPYVTTAHSRVHVALKALKLTREDVFVDLGCGDGRLALAAAAEFDVGSSVGIEVSPALVRCCHRAASHAGFDCAKSGSRLRFLCADIGALAFADDEKGQTQSLNHGADDAEAMAALDCATAIYVYSSPSIALALTPYLLRAIDRGARVLTLDYHMPAASDVAAVAALPSDCQALSRYLTPSEMHLFGKMRLYARSSAASETETVRASNELV